MNKYKFNKRKGEITEVASGNILKYFPPIFSLSGEVILLKDDTTYVVWEREALFDKKGNHVENTGGIWEWDDLLYDERLEHLFNL